MVSFAVGEKKNRWIEERMRALGIREEDLEETFVRSSGAGGQKVNKTSSCVYLKHLPTGVDVKCMKDRSQSINRFLARRELLEKIATMSGRPNIQDTKTEQIRKQKLKRKKRSRKSIPKQDRSRRRVYAHWRYPRPLKPIEFTNSNAIGNLSLRGAERLQGGAEANPEIPRFARNKLRNPLKNEIATPSGSQ